MSAIGKLYYAPWLARCERMRLAAQRKRERREAEDRAQEEWRKRLDTGGGVW